MQINKGGIVLRYKFTDKEINELLNKMVILVDSREQANDHVIEWFDKCKKKYKVQKLDYGDYSCYLPVGSFEGQTRDIYFNDEIVIERKFCIDELAMNLKDNKTNINDITKEIIELFGEKYLAKVLKTDYNRFKQELTTLNKYDTKFFILLEDEKFDENIRKGNYRSLYDSATLYKRLKGIEAEFNTFIRPIGKEFAGSEIYNTLRYGVRNILVHKGFMEN
jgi:hypothetical protein